MSGVWPWIRRRLAGRVRSAAHKVPVQLQMSVSECGAACLAMLLTYFGRETSVADCRDACPAGRDGVNVRILADAARRFGLRAKAYSLETESFDQVPLPAIVHWNFDHFVVVEVWGPHWIQIVDPAEGRRRVSHEEFGDAFTGVTLVLEPGEAFHARRRGKSFWATYFRSLVLERGNRSVLLQILGASVVLQILGLALPLFTKVLVDQVLPYRITGVLTLLGVGMLVWVLALLLFTFLRAMLLVYLQGRLDSSVMLSFFEHLVQLPLAFFRHRTSGDILMRLASNTVIRETVSSQTVALLLDGGLVVFYLSLFFLVEPVFGILVLVVGLIQTGVLVFSSRPVHRLMQRQLARQADSQAYAVEALKSITALKASGTEMRAFDRWSDLFLRQLNVTLQRNHLSAGIQTAMTSLQSLAPVLLLWFGTVRVLDGAMSLGTMLALNALAASFLTPLATVARTGQRLQLVRAHLDRIRDVLEARPEQAASGRLAPPLLGQIEVRGLTFGYDPGSPPVLCDVSFTVQPGEKLAIVGTTGSGKSTLLMLLLGLYRPTEGEILLDGIRLHDLDLRSVRCQIGVVLQEAQLFSGSIRDNLVLHTPDATQEEVVRAAQIAEIHDDVTRLPLQYQTPVSEGGATLSGGQRQRLCLARALIHKPSILVLDEATSHLDARTERKVDQHLQALSCTRIVVAHRLSSVHDADRILVIEKGRIIEQGAHGELLVQGEAYAQLMGEQLTQGLEPSEQG